MDKIPPGSVNQSIVFHLATAGLTIAGMKLGYIRWRQGDGTSFTEIVSVALAKLATISTVHTNNFAKYLDTDTTGGNQFILRVDFPDAAFATGQDMLICNVYDDGNNVIGQRIFALKVPDLNKYIGSEGPGIWINEDVGNTNTVAGIDGTREHPVSTLAAARTLDNKDGLLTKTYYITGQSDLTLGAEHQEWTIVGIGAFDSNEIDLGSQNVNRSCFKNIVVKGVQGGTERICIEGGGITDPSGAPVTTLHLIAKDVALLGDFEIDTSDDNILDKCYSGIPGNVAPKLIFTGASGTVVMTHYSGGIEVVGAGASHKMSLQTDGQVIFDAGVSVNFNISIRGNMSITDNTAGLNNLTKEAVFNAQENRDSAKLAPTAGTPADGSIDSHLDDNGYKDGFVYFSSGFGSAGDVLGVNGTYDNPCNDETDAKTLADLLGKKIRIDGTFTSTAAFSHYILEGLNGGSLYNANSDPAVDDSLIRNLKISKTVGSGFASGSNNLIFEDCRFIISMNIVGIAKRCGFFDTSYGLINAQGFQAIDCYAEIDSNIPDFDMSVGIGANEAVFHNFSGHMSISGQVASSKVIVYSKDTTVVTITSTAGASKFVGVGDLTDSSGGTHTLDQTKWSELPILEDVVKHHKYKEGFVYMNVAGGVAGVVLGINGTYDNPVNNDNDAQVLANQLGKKLAIFGQVTLDLNFNNYHIKGIDGAARVFVSPPNGGAPSFVGAFFEDVQIIGPVPSSSDTSYLRCLLEDIGDSVTFMGTARNCLLKGSSRINGALKLIDCGAFDSTAAIKFAGVNSKLLINNYQGPLLITDMDDAAHTLEVYSDGDVSITLNATNVLGTATFVGIGNLNDSSGPTTVVLTEWAELPLSGVGNILGGYPLGGVYYKDSASNTNTVLGTDGTIDNPVSSYAAVKTLADALGSKHIFVEGLLVVDVTTDGYAFSAIVPVDGAASAASQLTINGSLNWLGNTVRDLAVQTANTTFNDNLSRYYNCEMFGANTQLGGHYRDCIWNSSNIFDIQKETIIVGGSVKGATNQITFSVEATTDDLVISGLRVDEILFQNITTNNKVTLNIPHAKVSMDASCTGGEIIFIGDIIIGTNTGSTTINNDLNGLLNWLGTKVTSDGDWAALKSAVDLILSTGSTGPWTTAAPSGGDASEAKQDAIIATLGTPAGSSISDDNAAIKVVADAIQVVTDILASVDGVSLEDREKFTLAFIKGKIARSGNAFTYFAQNGTTSLFTLTGNETERINS